MKIAIMQPYIFPYLGYFQLINAVDKFIFYDDVNYIKRGWINRNRILVNNKETFFTVPVLKSSQNKLIHEVKLDELEKWLKKFEKTIEYNYKKAPYFERVNQLIIEVFNSDYNSLAELCINSVIKSSNYLGIDCAFETSSDRYNDTMGVEKAQRLISITKKNNSTVYVNSEGGNNIYKKSVFKKEGVDLWFLYGDLPVYNQFKSHYIKGLSIIDVLMFNSKKDVMQMLNAYDLK